MMSDQAQGLRALAEQQRLREQLERGQPLQRCRTIAVTSGKGGVGKTSLTTNLAILLARSGRRVLVFDADLGLANIDVLLGLAPRYHLHHVLQGIKSIEEIVITGPEGIRIVTGGSGILELAHLSEEKRETCLADLPKLAGMADIILFDTGAGLSPNVLAFVLAADEVLVVTTPEPTAIADAYAMIKVISQRSPDADLKLIVNMASSSKEAGDIAEKIISVSRQFLSVQVGYLGYLPVDPNVGKAVRRQQALSISFPGSLATHQIAAIARGLGYQRPRSGRDGAAFVERIRKFFKGD